MSRYIDAEKFKHIINNSKMYGTMEWHDVLEMLMEVPTADVVEAVHGEWKQNNLNGFKIYDCSNCGVHMEAKFNYCPFCGADMRGGRNEQIH